ncbi:L-rhamnose mutarotase [Phenylobacterium montanum]|uniref:L-rhamnose mutarotase n=1 Tax=Phenylobacterium montanum TaxID=2823693 RepID=A0A975FYU7_9CAUL|nr:L-rhamnose mutarotase [Caulobacter sp. S6]QUD87694.1 L-rhamnose mutarotase [Caulobacter sp. S6]
MRRFVLLLDLKDDPELIAAYRRWHAPGGPPAAVVASIRASGITDMEIHICGERLVMLVEAEDGFSFAAKAAADAADPEVMAWEAMMDRFQKALPWAKPGEKWTPAERIFALAEQP